MANERSGLNESDMETVDDQTEKRRFDEPTHNRIKITDLNQFCLEKIFDYLSLDDILNVSDANKYLKSATRMPFIWKYTGKSVRIDLSRRFDYGSNEGKIMFFNKQPNNDSIFNYEDIVIADLKKSLQMLRCFGGLMTELNLCVFSIYNRDYIYKHNNRIMSYIEEFCVDSLKKFSFENYCCSRFDGFQIYKCVVFAIGMGKV